MVSKTFPRTKTSREFLTSIIGTLGDCNGAEIKRMFVSETSFLPSTEKSGLSLNVAITFVLCGPDPVIEIFEGKTIVVSGVFEHKSRNELKKIIEENGGKVGSSISSKTSFVLAGDSMGPSKKEKANKLEIPLISESAFYEML